jgi:hypothetical protein
LLKRNSPFYLEAGFNDYGWAESVRNDPRPTHRTRWSDGQTARLTIKNPQTVPLRIALRAPLRAIGARDCVIKIAGEEVARLNLTEDAKIWSKPDFVLPSGETVIEFSSQQPPDLVGGRQKQAVTVAVDGIDIRVLGRIDGSVSTQ